MRSAAPTWYRSRSAKRDVLITCITPFVLLGAFAVFLLSTGAPGMDQSVFALVVMCLAVLFLAIRKELRKRRERLPIGIGVDEECIYIDRSIWSYGKVVTTIPRSDLVDMYIARKPNNVMPPTQPWYRYLRTQEFLESTCVEFSYHDKPSKDHALGVAIPVTLENLHELLHELCSHAGMEFWILDEETSRATWLDASAAALLEYAELYRRRRFWDLLLWR